MTGRLRMLQTATFALVALCAAQAFAQSRTVPYPRFNVERLTLNADGRDSLFVDTGAVLGEGQTRVTITSHYANGTAVTRAGEGYANLRLDERFLGHLAVAHAPAKWLQLHAEIPVVFHQTEGADLAARGFAPIALNGVAAPLVGARLAFLRQGDNGPFSLSGGATLGLPLGGTAVLGRDAQIPIRPVLSAGYDFGRFAVGGQVYGQFRSQENFSFRGISDSAEDTIDHEVGVALAISGEVVSKLRAELDVINDFSLRNSGNSLLAMLGLRYQATPQLELFAAGGPGFGTLVGTPQFRLFAGLGYSLGERAPPPREVLITKVEPTPPVEDLQPKDADKDGVPDSRDPCPDRAEDGDGFQDEDGCPDEDNDADGVPDAKDSCPNEPGPAHLSGCKLPDDDGDGIGNDVDKCPKEKGEIAENGCPPKDTDADGIPDRSDLCPQKAAPAGSTTGCPDTDGDGIADNVDNCVTDKGPEKNHGCPAKEKQLVVITREKLEILGKVYFANNRSRVLPRSRILLRQIARIMKEHPEIPKIRVEGHTDDRGRDAANEKLSQARAEAVRDFLIKEGVAPERVVARGFGETQPIQPNKTAAGREANRRVEFVIVDQSKAEAAPVKEETPELPELTPLVE